MLTELADPRAAPELLLIREQMRSWRFYDHLRTDAAAPARASQIGTRTMVLGSDGADLAAALQTIVEIGDAAGLRAAVDHAFPGSAVEIDVLAGRFELTMRQHGLLRPLRSAELSDGTVRYLLWIAALLTPRPPELLVLNEPENSLHRDLLAPLAALIAAASASAARWWLSRIRRCCSARSGRRGGPGSAGCRVGARQGVGGHPALRPAGAGRAVLDLARPVTGCPRRTAAVRLRGFSRSLGRREPVQQGQVARGLVDPGRARVQVAVEILVSVVTGQRWAAGRS